MRIALVGNGKTACGLGPLIDSHDFVIRFNLTPYYGRKTGYRTDALVIMNMAGPGWKLATGRAHLHFGAVRSAEEVWFLARPERVQGIDTLTALQKQDFAPKIAANLLHGKKTAYAPLPAKGPPLREFGSGPGEMGSSGTAVLAAVLELWPDAEINLFGFTHQGWSGHPWAAERAWVDSLPNVRRIEAPPSIAARVMAWLRLILGAGRSPSTPPDLLDRPAPP